MITSRVQNISHRGKHSEIMTFNSLFPSPPLLGSGLNEELVQLLLIRDELHTEQDAMLVDIEDLTRLVIFSD